MRSDPTSDQDNRRNDSTHKTVKCNDGVLPIDVPCDWYDGFELELIKKGQSRIDGKDNMIIGLDAERLSTRDIRVHLEGVDGLKFKWI